MGGSGAAFDLYRKFELEVRTPKRRLLVDAFLPTPESLLSAVAPAPPPPSVEIASGAGGLGEQGEVRDLSPEPPPPPPRRRKSAPAPAAPEKTKSLQEEIEEFMNRDQRGMAPDDDLSAFTTTSLDPNLDPEPGNKT